MDIDVVIVQSMLRAIRCMMVIMRMTFVMDMELNMERTMKLNLKVSG